MAPTTGLPALDEVLQQLKPGDNVVWRIYQLGDYVSFVEPFAERALSEDRPFVYIRFANHEPLLEKNDKIKVLTVNPEKGFEQFITSIHETILEAGEGACYVFDLLSDLSFDCYSDRMIGNFYKLTCPILYELNTIAYYGMYRHYHSYHAMGPIEETAQIMLDVYTHDGKTYVQPAKVAGRHSPTMYTLHVREGDQFRAVRDSVGISEVMTSSTWPGLRSASYRMVGAWDRHFLHAEEVLESYRQGKLPEEETRVIFRRLLRQLLSSDKRILEMASQFLSLEDVVYIWKRMIGTGMIGGKSVGMLLARAILKKTDPKWEKLLEPHDSFFVGSDIFYTFLVENNCWWEKQKQKDPDKFLEGNEEVRRRIMEGRFSDYTMRRFADMLDYFGQSPIIVRSSSLLEDSFGNTFAGKYDSVFCANQGTREQRMEGLLSAVRTIYASTMSREALTYRSKRGLLDRDEQMALLVQRVSGSVNGDYYYPQLAGVGFSYNPYVWSKDIDPNAGVVRLVYGLGTRAVDRSDDDYTRVVALNAPQKRPDHGMDDVRRHAQRKVDVLSLDENTFKNVDFVDILRGVPSTPVALFAAYDDELARSLAARGRKGPPPRMLTFDPVMTKTEFVATIKEMLATLREIYTTHVDVEFSANFSPEQDYKINLLQCRPFRIQEPQNPNVPLPEVTKESLIFDAHGGVVGQGKAVPLDRLVYVVPAVYGEMPIGKRHELARLIGRLTHHNNPDSALNIALIGPGRWGTSTPSLGVPVRFSDISNCAAICEIDSIHEGLSPDLSLGTHFFNEMVEANITYIGYFSMRSENSLNAAFFMDSPTRLTDLGAPSDEFENAVKVLDIGTENCPCKMYLKADPIEQQGTIYADRALV